MSKEIKSLQNARVKAAVRLREGRHRQKQGRFLIDGLRELARGFHVGLAIREVFYCREICTPQQSRQLDAILEQMQAAGSGKDPALQSRKIELTAVSQTVFRKMAFGDRAEGVLAVAEVPERGLSQLELDGRQLPGRQSTELKPIGSCIFKGRKATNGSLVPRPKMIGSPSISCAGTNNEKKPLLAVLEGIEKPGNIGAVVRSADAAGLDAVILADCRTDEFNPNAIRASLGTILTFPVCPATTEETIAWLREREMPIFAARVDAAVPYTEIDFRGGGAIVLGSEAEGLSQSWTGNDIRDVRLPMHGVADSLNISATAAVLFYEALRQRG